MRTFSRLGGIGAMAAILGLLPAFCLPASAQGAATGSVAILQKVAWENGHLVVQADRPVEFAHHLLHDPDRLIVDVLGADEPATGLPAEIRIGAGAIADIRIARHPEAGLVRMVLDLTGTGEQISWKADDPPPVIEVRATPAPIVRRPREPIEKEPVKKVAIEPETESDEPASPSIWPAQDQLVDRLRVEREGRDTILDLHAQRPLMAWIEQQLDPPRLTVRVPRSAFSGPPPVAQGLIRSLEIVRKDREWDLSAALSSGLYVCHRLRYDHGRGLEVEIRKRAAIAHGRPVVVLDPGHGGYDPGTAGPSGDLEKDVALDVAQRAASALERDGYQVVLTRTMDAFVRLADRRAFMASLGAVAFVSLHCNSSPAATVDGIETYYRESASQALAQTLQRHLVAATRDVDRGARQAQLFVLKGGSVPASLVELGFLTNPKEEKRLRDPGYQATLARAVATGIRDYLNGRTEALSRRAIAMESR